LRFIHTADWHLGRLFYGNHLTEDQAHALNQVVDLCREHRPDVLIVAGDIYDRAVPPPEAVELLDDVLCRLVLDVKVPVVLIAGNHDSPGRLHFAARLLSGQGLHVRGTLSADLSPIVLHDAHGPIHVYALPYSEPSVVQQALNSAEDLDHHGAMAALTGKCREKHPSGCRSILVAHAFVTGGQISESERPLSIGGAGTVDASCFEGFHYVALGHLHRPQQIKCNGTPVHYSGSLLKYSFDEADHVKSVALVEMDGDGKCQMQAIPIRPRRDVRRVTAKFADLLASRIDGVGEDDYLEVTLLDEGPIVNLMTRLREVFPNSAQLRRAGQSDSVKADGARLPHEGRSDLQLFRDFYAHVTAKPLSDAQERTLANVLDSLSRSQRHA